MIGERFGYSPGRNNTKGRKGNVLLVPTKKAQGLKRAPAKGGKTHGEVQKKVLREESGTVYNGTGCPLRGLGGGKLGQ